MRLERGGKLGVGGEEGKGERRGKKDVTDFVDDSILFLFFVCLQSSSSQRGSWLRVSSLFSLLEVFFLCMFVLLCFVADARRSRSVNEGRERKRDEESRSKS